MTQGLRERDIQTGQRGASFVRRRSTIGLSIIFIGAFLLIQPAKAASRYSKDVQERQSDVFSSNTKIEAVLSDLVYGYRSGLPELVMSHYATKNQWTSLAAVTPASREDELVRFFRDFHAGRGCPLLYMADRKITWDKGEATVTCVMIWNIADARGRTLRFRTDEEFIVALCVDRYRIVSSRTTPLVARHLPNVRVLERELKKSLERTSETHPSQP